MTSTAACANTPYCQNLLALTEAARKDWITKHAASCQEGQPHSSICNQAYAYYLARLRAWHTACCQKYDSTKVEGADIGFELFRAFEESKAAFGARTPIEKET